ncbi:glycosyl transferase, group 2 family protein [Lachnospiraceae bacterium KM106-2]|nr:glycosyl transferase, group 2 family protein [Lachnospiraceae bacterium KM106-2]
MITISLCMIVKNEEDNLGNCLESVKEAVDEIIIVDTGSTDRTKEIASRYTDKIFDFTWIDDFSAARNESFRHATMDYLLWLDADDIIKKEDLDKLIALKKEFPTEYECVMFDYDYAFNEMGKPILTFKRERLVKREANFLWEGFIHEVIDCHGKCLNANITVTHNKKHGNGMRNYNIYRKHIDAGETLNVRDQYYYAKELWGQEKFDEALKAYLDLIDSEEGWYENRIDAINQSADILIGEKEYRQARNLLWRAFEITTPRAEALFRLAFTFEQENRIPEAIYWFTQILTLQKPKTAGFIFDEYWNWRPYLELCVCYDRMGQKKLAYEFNKKAASYMPDHPSIVHNNQYFEEYFKKEKE